MTSYDATVFMMLLVGGLMFVYANYRPPFA